MKKLAVALVSVLGLGVALNASYAAAQTSPSTTAKKPAATAQKAPAAGAAKTPAAPAAKAAPALNDPKQKFSYALGMNMASGLSRQGVEIDPDVFAKGLKDQLAGKTLMTEDEERAVLMQAQTEFRAKQQEKAKQASAANKKAGEDFLAANNAKEGVVALPSGLQYKILKEGTGPKPTVNDTVVCNYRGTLIDGKEFDSSYKRGEPAKFPVGGVIKGWTEALQLMPVGSKWQLFIPASLAYGERGAGADIGPDSTLIFEVELISIEEKK